MSTRGTVLHSHGPGEQLKADDVELTVGPGETLVEMRLAAVTPLDRSTLAGKQPRVPFVPGSEGTGVVVSSDVAAAGATVVVRGEGVGVTRQGVWGRYAVVPNAAVHALPSSLEPAAALALLTPALTAHTAVRRVADVQQGETVVVTGVTGLIGRMCAAIARAAGAARVIGLVSLDDAADSADSADGLVDQVVRVDGLGQVGRELPWCDAVIDTMGGPVTGGVLGHVSPGGRIAVLGYKAGEFTTIDLHKLVGRDLRLLPVNLQRTTLAPEAVGEALADIASVPWRADYDVVPANRIGDVLGRSSGRVLLDLTTLSAG
ncbi:zinc-binding alcohol dehydrogenase family protein [Kribbella sp.]|uniref:zinc-binding alcohol dehydrogenase family protein n=1 Tax=Kribbella sp. TaxID=1871183 RepID=UPI002D6FFD5C|nr:zinc-binding alcohol dehydrogenase family protein [Kribbella sp.]HZX04698.1 zinc-binding alcohol dehydrogenase family protein [Kribbella sp.]